MSLTIFYRDVSSLTGLYARVQRLRDEKWWDAVAQSWVSSADSDCNITLNEQNPPGYYSATDSNLSSPYAEMYQIYIYNSSDTNIHYTEYRADDGAKNALNLVNEVQRKLRLPETASAAFASDSHARLILSMVNEVIHDHMLEGSMFDELKVRGAFLTTNSVSKYQVWPVNVNNVEVIRRLQIGNDEPLVQKTDSDFRDYLANNTTDGQPYVFRNYSRGSGMIMIELAPPPDSNDDDNYMITYEIMQKPSLLINATDLCPLDSEMVVLGSYALAKKEQGDEWNSEWLLFQARLDDYKNTYTAGNLTEFTPV